MRRPLAVFAVVVVAAGCQGSSSGIQPPPADRLLLQPLEATPYTQVTVGPVQALVPHRWDSAPVIAADSFQQEGLMASPRLEAWQRLDGSVQGMSAVWLDVGRVGIPTDYYYLAASGPVLQGLTAREGCERSYLRVIVDHRPTFAGTQGSPADFVARAGGTCTAEGGSTRWAYFIAAPGFGPVREMGIPTSGLYVVVAVIRESPDAARQLRNLLLTARFGNASVEQLIEAARASAGQL
jgi:hypothetical protein